MQQAMRQPQPAAAEWGTSLQRLDAGRSLAHAAQAPRPLQPTDIPRRGLEPLGGRPVFSKASRPGLLGRFSQERFANVGQDEAPHFTMGSFNPHEPSLGYRHASRGGIAPTPETPQSAEAPLGIGADAPRGRHGPPNLHLRGSSVFARGDQPLNSPTALESDLQAATALTSIGKGVDNFPPWGTDVPTRARRVSRPEGLDSHSTQGVSRQNEMEPNPHSPSRLEAPESDSHMPDADLTIVGSPLKRRRADEAPSASRIVDHALDWHPLRAPQLSVDASRLASSAKDAPETLKGTPPDDDNPDHEHRDGFRAPSQGPDPELNQKPGKLDSGAIFKPEAQRCQAGMRPDQDPMTQEAEDLDAPHQHRLGHCASSSFRYWADENAANPSGLHKSAAASDPPAGHDPHAAPESSKAPPARSCPADSQVDHHANRPDHGSLQNSPGQAVQGPPGGPVHLGKNTAGQPGHAADAIPGDLNDSDASETSHSEPGLEQTLWTQCTASLQAPGPQPFTTEPPAKRHRSGSLPGELPLPHSLTATAVAASPGSPDQNPTANALAEVAAAAELRQPLEGFSEADHQLVAQALDDSNSTPTGQLSRLEAILACLKKRHLREQPFRGSAPSSQATSAPGPSSVALSNAQQPHTAPHASAGPSGNPATQQPPAGERIAGQHAAAIGPPESIGLQIPLSLMGPSLPLAPALPSNKAGEASGSGAFHVLRSKAEEASGSEAAHVPHSKPKEISASRGIDDPSSRPGGDSEITQPDESEATRPVHRRPSSAAVSRPTAGVVPPADVSPNETSLLAYFAAAAQQQEGAEVSSAHHSRTPTFIQPSIHPSIHSFLSKFVLSFIHSLSHPSIHSLIHLSDRMNCAS